VYSCVAMTRRSLIERRKPSLTDEKAEQAIAMLQAGNSPAKVAKAVGVGKSTIYSRIQGEWAPRLVGSAGK
jgi:DNA invertase Pin-like site-specific DNA recombinase